MQTIQLNRIGYGSSFNNIYIINDTIKKESKNTYGDNKLKKEIIFYKNIHSLLSTPEIYEYGQNYYIMKYYKDHLPLYTIFPVLHIDKKVEILLNIYKQIEQMHFNTIQSVSKEEFTRCLLIETDTKIRERYTEITNIVQEFNYIKNVNNVELLDFETIMKRISNKIHTYIKSLNEYNFCIIHGDCQFNNVLYNTSKNDIIFIDPRGYFGNMDLYGLKEYDYAKILFALTGYDVFDNMDIQSLNISENNLILDNIFQIDNPFNNRDIITNDIISTLTISIWLGNAHCFKHNKHKAAYSYFYALYLATIYL